MIRTDVLHYTERTNGEYRDSRQVTLRWKRKFARLSLNGQYRTSKSHHEMHRSANPGWSFGTEWYFINWTHFRNHCFHISLNVRKRGITFSYGKWT